jgi:hypothetical protein
LNISPVTRWSPSSPRPRSRSSGSRSRRRARTRATSRPRTRRSRRELPDLSRDVDDLLRLDDDALDRPVWSENAMRFPSGDHSGPSRRTMLVLRELLRRAAPVLRHEPDLLLARPVGDVGDLRAVGRPHRRAVVGVRGMRSGCASGPSRPGRRTRRPRAQITTRSPFG